MLPVSHIDDLLLLCVVNVGLLDHFIPFFIHWLLRHIFSSHDTDSVQRLVQSSEFALRRNGQLFCGLAVSTARVLSVGHRLDIATVAQLCDVVHHDGQFGVHFRVNLLKFTRSGSRHIVLPSDVQLLVGLVIGCHVVLKLDDRHFPVGGRRRLGRLVEHLVVRCLVRSSLAPLPRSSEDLSFVTSQRSVIVRDFAQWGR